MGRGIDEWVWACAQQLRVLLHGEVVTTATVVSYASNGLTRFFKFLITTQATYPPRALDRRHLDQFVAWLKAHPTITKPEAQRGAYTKVKAILVGLANRGLVLRGKEIFPRNPFPRSTSSMRGEAPYRKRSGPVWRMRCAKM